MNTGTCEGSVEYQGVSSYQSYLVAYTESNSLQDLCHPHSQRTGQRSKCITEESANSGETSWVQYERKSTTTNKDG